MPVHVVVGQGQQQRAQQDRQFVGATAVQLLHSAPCLLLLCAHELGVLLLATVAWWSEATVCQVVQVFQQLGDALRGH